LGPVVRGYFNEVSSKYQIEDFILGGQETVRNELFDQVVKALEELRVEARLTTIVSVDCESDEINAEFRKLADSRQEIRQLEHRYAVEKVRNKVVEEELKAVKAKQAASEEVLIGLFGRTHRAEERKAEIMVKAPVPQVIVAGSDTPLGPLMMPQLIRDQPAPPPRPRSGLAIELQDDAVTMEIEGMVDDGDGSA
jgi:hypothetical protein